ncbi:hypothetical protein FOMPIDRAFT_1017561 [Fomitopsis schrenkii]|uniref:Transmembrane protein n=1 Tax=Fomitopsis schrenkii TaxID=2126942 RepID=S8FK25_FOMSC|nr:hypothetical protein FOMPIDRAFT_1017561 [Fomitopsis schrenkii]
MAPVPASLCSAPSWMSTLAVSIGDKNQIIVYTAILVSFIALFVIGLVYVLRIYNASLEDEESNTTSTPRPPLRLLLPGDGQQRATSSTPTLIVSGTPPKTSQTRVKRSGSGPSPLPLICGQGKHVHTDPAPETTEQDVNVTEELSAVNVERPADVNIDVTDVVVIAPEVDSTNEDSEEAVVSELEVDIADAKVNWLASGPVLMVDSDVADMIVLSIETNKVSVSGAECKERKVSDVLTDTDAVNIGNAFLQMGEVLPPKALMQESPARLAKPASSRRGKPTTDNGTTDSGLEGSPSVTSISSPSKSAKCGLLPFQPQPRRGDLWAAALDRLARHVTHEEYDEDTLFIGDAEHVASGDAQHARKAPSPVKEDGSLKHTPGDEMAITPEPSNGRMPDLEAKVVSSGTSVPAFTYCTDDVHWTISVPPDGKPHKEVRFAGDLNAEIGDHCRISYDVGAAYLKVKVAPAVTTLRLLSSDSFSSTADSLDSNASHRLSLLADLALGTVDSVSDKSGSSGSFALSIDSALATRSSSEEGFVSLSDVSDPVAAPQHTDNGECASIIIAEEEPDEDANNDCDIGPSESSQALRDRILGDCKRILKERRLKLEEQERKRREEADKVYASFCERRQQHRLLDVYGSPATAYTPPLTPDVGGDPSRNNYDSGYSDRNSMSPATPVFGSWSGARTPSPLLGNLHGNSAEADVWTFLPGNTGPDADLATSASGNLHGPGLIQYKVGEDVPLPPRRAFTMSPSEEKMKSYINVEENLDENAERNFHEFGTSYSTQALRNLIMKDCKKAIERRRLDFEASMATRQSKRAKQVVAILNESGELNNALGLAFGSDSEPLDFSADDAVPATVLSGETTTIWTAAGSAMHSCAQPASHAYYGPQVLGARPPSPFP